MRRVLFQHRAQEPGPTLVGLGGLHGNEPAGVRALVASGARTGEGGLARGEFVGLAGNLPALAAGVRCLDCDLNRVWDASNPRGSTPQGRDASEREALREALGAIRARARGPVHLVDLHTASGDGPPFIVAGDGPDDRAISLALPVPVVFGLAEALPGTLVHALARSGMSGFAFEAGAHEDPRSERRCADALWLLLSALGMASAGSARRIEEARRELTDDARGFPRALRLAHRHPLESPHRFRMRPGMRSFQAVCRGELLAADEAGDIRAPMSGRLLLPLYQDTGTDGFFVARAVGSDDAAVSPNRPADPDAQHRDLPVPQRSL